MFIILFLFENHYEILFIIHLKKIKINFDIIILNVDKKEYKKK